MTTEFEAAKADMMRRQGPFFVDGLNTGKILKVFEFLGVDPDAPAGTNKKKLEEHAMLMRKFGSSAEECV